MYCNNCGQEVNDNDKFCGHCGSRINIETYRENINFEINKNNDITDVQSVKLKTKFTKYILIALITLIFISISSMIVIYTKSPEFVIYKSVIAMKNNDYEKTIKYISIEKIIDNRVNDITTGMLNDPSLKNNPFAGLAYAFIESIKPKLVDYIQTEFKNIIESPDNIFQDISSFKLLYFTIAKKYGNISLNNVTKEPKKAILEFIGSENNYKLRICFIKNSKNQWEIVDITGYEFWKEPNAKKLQHYVP